MTRYQVSKPAGYMIIKKRKDSWKYSKIMPNSSHTVYINI